MKLHIVLVLSLVLVSILSVACGIQGPGEAVSGVRVDDQASLIEALRAAGAGVELGDGIEQGFFSVTGRLIRVGSADVQVFEYASAQALEADAGQVAPNGGSIGTAMVTWVASPHFFKSGRVLVLYVGDDSRVLAWLQTALGEQFAGR